MSRLFYRWEGRNLTDRDWCPMGVAMHADPRFGETPGGLQAPHVVPIDGAYHMFYGDWEHVCVLVSLDDLGDRDAAPVGLHFHAHGGLEVADAASAWHADVAGSFHPRVFVEASGHASYRNAGETLLGPHEGGRIDPDGLTHPLVFLRPHATNRSDPADEILGGFGGRWGQTEGDAGESPIGPLEFNQPCDHDWKGSPGLSDWQPACAT